VEPTTSLGEALRVVTEDSLFVLAGSARANLDSLRVVARRRSDRYQEVARGTSRTQPSAFVEWVRELCSAVAPVAPPSWMPMAEVIEAGVSLEGGARGLRSLFTSKPSEKEVERVMRLGNFALRALTAVLGSDGAITEDEALIRQALLASLGLADGHVRMLTAEPPMAVEALEIPEDLDTKFVRLIVRGAWLAAARDGFDPREEEAVQALARRLRALAADIETTRAEAQQALTTRKAVGVAAIDALRFLLTEPAQRPLLEGVVRLWLPPSDIDEPLAAIAQNAPITFAQRHRLDREGKRLVLYAAWLAALHSNPTIAQRAELIAKHETIASDLDAGAIGGEAREELDAFVEGELLAAMGRPV